MPLWMWLPDRTPLPLGLLLQRGDTPLNWAAGAGRKAVVELLLGAGAAVETAVKVRHL
jgi:ankyrin repeat protein